MPKYCLFKLLGAWTKLRAAEISERFPTWISQAPQVIGIHLRVAVELPEVPVDRFGVQEGRKAVCLVFRETVAVAMKVVDVVFKPYVWRIHEIRIVDSGHEASSLLLG
ncbi:MAG: hypothetical protein ACREQQ_09865 [Candidatus Binatia bacterium]